MNQTIDLNEIGKPAFIASKDNITTIENKMFRAFFTDENDKKNALENIIEEAQKRVQRHSSTFFMSLNFGEFLVDTAGLGNSRILFTFTEFSQDMKSDLSSNLSKDITNDFIKVLSALHDDCVIIDKNGIIINALPNFKAMYGISHEDAIGRTIFEMEERKIFNPSVAIRVLNSKKAETMLQLTGSNKYLMCTAIPIFDNNNEIDKIVSYTRDITEYQTLRDEYNNLEERLKIYSAEIERLRSKRELPLMIAGRSEVMKNMISTIMKIADFDATVLFLGESGVGKTMYAKLMHSQSSRSKGPFIEINCGAIPESLLESELFGYEKGAFTGAGKDGKPGMIELANKGTLFLDEIGDLPLHMQVKLLNTIQDKKITRVGGSAEKQVDFRLITATNKDLETMVEKKVFREDLYYRLNVISIKVPSLRERKEDIFPLSNHFLEKTSVKYNVNRTLSNSVRDYLVEYDWPGNIRELENLIERLILTSKNYMITEDALPAQIKTRGFNSNAAKSTLKCVLESVEKKIILDSYKKHGTTTGVAAELSISQPSASIKIKKYTASDI